MSSEVFEALSLLEKERGIPVDFMLDKIKKRFLPLVKAAITATTTRLST